MGNPARFLFGRSNEEGRNLITGEHLPQNVRFLHLSEIKDGVMVVVKTSSGMIYRFVVKDLENGLVELLEGNTRFFGKMPVICVYLGALASRVGVIYPKMIVEGACMAFSDAASTSDGESRIIMTSYIMSFWVEEPTNAT